MASIGMANPAANEIGKIGEGMVVLIAGIYIVVVGATSKYLINETDVVATEEERSRAKATPVKRLLCIVFGLACAVYGVIRILR